MRAVRLKTRKGAVLLCLLCPILSIHPHFAAAILFSFAFLFFFQEADHPNNKIKLPSSFHFYNISKNESILKNAPFAKSFDAHLLFHALLPQKHDLHKTRSFYEKEKRERSLYHIFFLFRSEASIFTQNRSIARRLKLRYNNVIKRHVRKTTWHTIR